MPGKNESNVAKYDVLSPVYDLGIRRNPVFARPRARMFELARIQPGDRVLVVGVGTGLDLPYLPPTAEVTGIDLSASMLQRAQARVQDGHCTLRRMGAEELRFEDASFDVVVMNCVLSVVEDPARALAEAARVLRPSGSVWILGRFCETAPGPLRRAASRVTAATVGADLTLSLTASIGSTPLRMSRYERGLGVDVIQLVRE